MTRIVAIALAASLLPTVALAQLNRKLERTMDRIARTHEVSPERQAVLDEAADAVIGYLAEGESAKLLFICTHNSRRSHMGQLWAMASAKYYDISNIVAFSGGTEATKMNRNAAEALDRAGFDLSYPQGTDGSYQARFASDELPIALFSKKYTHPLNPQSDFIAMMVCSDADENCPLVQGASHRVSLPYADPRVADGTPNEDEAYDATAKLIASEMLYLFGRVAEKQEQAGR